MRRPSPLAIRLLAVLLLVIFVPVAGFWSLAEFERALLIGEERAMISQAQALAAALAGPDPLEAQAARDLLSRLERPLRSRLRVVREDGEWVADSSATGSGSEHRSFPLRSSWLYRLGAGLAELGRRLRLSRPEHDAPRLADERSLEPEVAEALAGRYGSATRRSADGSFLLLTSAVPIRSQTGVTGAVVASRTTIPVLVALDRVRVDLFRVVLISIAAASLVAWMLARSLVRPLVRLSRAAEAAGPSGSGEAKEFPGVDRRDEIGDLARSLTLMRSSLDARLDELEAFASEVAHELSNPLAAVRSAGELLGEVDASEDRHRLARLIEREVARMQAVVTGLHDLASFDAERSTETAQRVDLCRLAESVAEAARVRRGRQVEVRVITTQAIEVPVPPERAAQVVENLLANAIDFSPLGEAVEVVVASEGDRALLEVCDGGPGIPPEERQRIFERFYTRRPLDDGARHLGLGLNLVRSIVERYGGSIEVSERLPSGARFRVFWPHAPVRS